MTIGKGWQICFWRCDRRRGAQNPCKTGLSRGLSLPSSGTMLLMPSEHAMPVMKADYAAMRNMIYGDYPSFDEILSTIKKLETEINSSL